jgi:hypothetical protein
MHCATLIALVSVLYERRRRELSVRLALGASRDLLRHVVPSGDPAVIVDRALTVLVEQLEKSRRAAARRLQAQARVTSTGRARAGVGQARGVGAR